MTVWLPDSYVTEDRDSLTVGKADQIKNEAPISNPGINTTIESNYRETRWVNGHELNDWLPPDGANTFVSDVCSDFNNVATFHSDVVFKIDEHKIYISDIIKRLEIVETIIDGEARPRIVSAINNSRQAIIDADREISELRVKATKAAEQLADGMEAMVKDLKTTINSAEVVEKIFKDVFAAEEMRDVLKDLISELVSEELDEQLDQEVLLNAKK